MRERKHEANDSRNRHSGDEGTGADGTDPRHGKYLNFQRFARPSPLKKLLSDYYGFPAGINHLDIDGHVARPQD
jgi:hypothetical protein